MLFDQRINEIPTRLEHVRALNGIGTLKEWWERLQDPGTPENAWWPSYASVRNYHHQPRLGSDGRPVREKELRLAPTPYVARVAEVFRLTSDEFRWLATGVGTKPADTAKYREEHPIRTRDSGEMELFRISNAVYEELGVPTTLPSTDVPEGAERFWGPAIWAPLVRQTALRLYQHRPSWAILAERSEEGGERALEEARVEDPELRFWLAVEDTAKAIAAPLKAIGVDASQLTLEDVSDYVSAVALTLQRTMWRYAPGAPDEVKESPLMAALLKPYIDEPVPEEED